MALLLLLQRRFFSRFMEGRPGPWGALAAGIFGFRMLLKWGRKSEDVTYRTVLKPGETLTIAHTPDTEVSAKRVARTHKRAARKARRRSTGEAPDGTSAT
jgi:hypothetical protein